MSGLKTHIVLPGIIRTPTKKNTISEIAWCHLAIAEIDDDTGEEPCDAYPRKSIRAALWDAFAAGAVMEHDRKENS